MKKNITVDKFEGVVALINEKFIDIAETLARIERQTTKTNGTVAELKDWKSTSKGAISVLSGIVIPILLYLVYLHM